MSKSLSRVRAMDDVRVILALLGLVLHAAGAVISASAPSNDTSIWSWIEQVIHVFRMQAFFVISGYLGYHGLHRLEYLTKRTRQLLLPGLATLMILFPLVTGKMSLLTSFGAIEFYSVWFLVTLYVMTVFMWIAFKTGLLSKITDVAKTSPLKLLSGMIMVQMLLLYSHRILGRGHYWSTHFGVVETMMLTVDYCLYYLGGMLLAQLPLWQDKLHHVGWRITGFMSLILWSIMVSIYPDLVHNIPYTVFTTVTICLGIMSLATKTDLDLGWTKPLCKASLTIYLWQLPCITVAQWIWASVDTSSSPVLHFIWILEFALLMSMAAYYIIARSAWLRWLWLGEAMPPILSIDWSKIKITPYKID